MSERHSPAGAGLFVVAGALADDMLPDVVEQATTAPARPASAMKVCVFMMYVPRRRDAKEMRRPEPARPGRSRSRSPGTTRDRGPEVSQVGHRKSEGALLLGALICRHQHLDDADAVVEGESRSLETEERADAVAAIVP